MRVESLFVLAVLPRRKTQERKGEAPTGAENSLGFV